MDPKSAVLEISSDEEVDDHKWITELLGDDSDDVVVVNEFDDDKVKDFKKQNLKSLLVNNNNNDDVFYDDECILLEKDPNAPVEVLDVSANNGDDDDIVVVSEKGQVACRDYPHSRHLCIKFPFSSTPNQSHCNQCYCYVCDSLAPCVYWGNGSTSTDHCHATDKEEFWKHERKNARKGGKPVQPVTQLTPLAMLRSQNQIPRPGPILANHTSATFQYPGVISQSRNNMLASRNRLHPNLVSRLGHRAQQRSNTGYRVHRPVFKRPHPVRAATTTNQIPYSSYRGNIGNPIRQPNYQVNGMLSGSSKYLGSLQPNAVNAPVPYPPSQTYTSPNVNQPQPQFSYNPNPNFQSHVNSNPISETPLYPQVRNAPPSSSRLQPASSQQTYTVPVQPSYHVPSQTQVGSPLFPVSDFAHNTLQGNQSQGHVVDSGFKDYGLGLPTGQDSATVEGVGVTNESSLAAGSGGLADYQFDWIFDNQPIEPGFTDYSSDSAFIDTGPIFQF
ncbi:hypothetical protein M8C21_008800 [Ambrosia artemisiifolia]|uniref:Uncharacterized protein n=1 Tax=Ambrosia artemisiifolia TaxID=4212 RepID=A0AAD5GAM9_AMBAR|nr:hypothetical protein M8C21_008800 [Ambrosia artemisiifolia]